ncbi:LysR family transcriptional regulator, partial [Burkholderia cenocepacia]|nr:LysR family transcriptional regulator [Burkholderia cenocepacia]
APCTLAHAASISLKPPASVHGANRRIVRLAVTTTASFANTWLVQRLGSFHAAYPEIEITVETRAQLV